MTRPDASPPPRSNDPARRQSAPLSRALALTLVLAAFGWATSASAQTEAAASPPEPAPAVSLSNDHVGMSADQIETSQTPVPDVSPTVAPAPTAANSELQSAADQLAAVAEEKKRVSEDLTRRAHDTARALEAAEAGHIPGVGPNEQGPANYESCAEATIRRGDTFASADRLCRVIYPDAADLGKHAPRGGDD